MIDASKCTQTYGQFYSTLFLSKRFVKDDQRPGTGYRWRLVIDQTVIRTGIPRPLALGMTTATWHQKPQSLGLGAIEMIKLFFWDPNSSTPLRFVDLVCSWSLDACVSEQLRWQRRPTGQHCSYSCSTDWRSKTKHRSSVGEAKDFSKGCKDDEGNVINHGGESEIEDVDWPTLTPTVCLVQQKIGGRAWMRKKQRHNKNTLSTRKREAGVLSRLKMLHLCNEAQVKCSKTWDVE